LKTHAASVKPSRAPSWAIFGSTAWGDYRLIADIQDGRLRILIVRIGNRREVYR
jgi:mRNA interferase RelE/StbE